MALVEARDWESRQLVYRLSRGEEGKEGHITTLPYLPSGSGRDQTQGLHHLAHFIDIAVQINRPKDGFDRRCHCDWRDITALRWVTANMSVESASSTDSV